MIGLGTLANVTAIIIGSGIGILLKNGLKQRIQDMLMQACGLAVIIIGLSGTLKEMFSVKNGIVSVSETMLLVFSLVIGGLIGEAVNIEYQLDKLGNWFKRLIKTKNDSKFVEGFVNASLIVCIGAMAVVGSIEDGLTGDPSMLLAKSLLDCILVLVLASTYGIGVMFSAIPVGIYQGLITLFAIMIEPLLSDTLISNLSFIGSVLIFGVGVNLSFGKKYKVGNLLPALLVPIFYEIICKIL